MQEVNQAEQSRENDPEIATKPEIVTTPSKTSAKTKAVIQKVSTESKSKTSPVVHPVNPDETISDKDRPILCNRFLPIPILTDSLILNLADTDTDFQQ